MSSPDGFSHTPLSIASPCMRLHHTLVVAMTKCSLCSRMCLQDAHTEEGGRDISQQKSRLHTKTIPIVVWGDKGHGIDQENTHMATTSSGSCFPKKGLVISNVSEGRAAHLVQRASSAPKALMHSNMAVDPATALLDSVKKACTAYFPGRGGPSSKKTYRDHKEHPVRFEKACFNQTAGHRKYPLGCKIKTRRAFLSSCHRPRMNHPQDFRIVAQYCILRVEPNTVCMERQQLVNKIIEKRS